MATAPVNKDSHLYLVDASAYIFRAFHALPPLTRASDDLPIGAVSGFCNMLFKLLEDLKGDERPTHFACIFDKSSITFRNELYDQYKANRSEPPEELRPQFPLVRRAAEAFAAHAIEKEGFEADDLIATYARQAEAKGARVTIVSSDKDLMQLVSDTVLMLDTMKNKTMGREQVFEKFGVGPEKVVDIQSLAGDSVDNVPGAPGIGVKTAAQLLDEYGDLDTLLARAEEIKQPKRRQTLIDNADLIRISKQLVTLKDDVPLDVPLEDLAVQDPDPDTLINFLEEMEFRTITRRVREMMELEGTLESAQPAEDPIDRSKYICIRDFEELEEWITRATKQGYVAVDTETDSLDSIAANLVGVSLALAPNEACYIPLAHVDPDNAGDGDMFGADPPRQIRMQDALRALKPMLEDPAILKIGQNIKYDLSVFATHNIDVAPIDDTMLLSYVLNAGKHNHGMDTLSERYLQHNTIPFKEIAGTGKSQVTFDRIALDKATEYAAEDADITLRLWQVFKPQLRTEKVMTVYETLERPLVPVLAHMEQEGIKVDRDHLSRLSSDFSQRMAALEAEAYEQAGREFNIGSPKQLGEILFDEMGLEGGKKTKTGAWQTDADVLEGLAAEGHGLPRTIVDWRTLSKLRSTYTEALQAAINPDTGRVHTSYSMAVAQTGRLSSTDPNLQNIPVRTEEGRKIREAFVAEKGNVLVSADYSQIELRILAHIADIDALKDAFKEGLDIHALTASEMFDVPIEGMDPMVRRQAKAINFGIIYGISGFGLARQLGIPQSEASEYIKTYFKRFPGIRAYMDETKAFAKEHGYVTTAYGRKINLSGIKSKGPQRSFAERQAINAPIQGSAADIIKRAMIRMPDVLAKASLSARMLLQVHDELVFECPEAEADKLIETVKTTMQGAAGPSLQLSVPLVVDARAASNWAEAH
ncbi:MULTISPECIES: DNA polymerase I [unclassified Hyphomonas]|jgi:DNA polymerase-1|uniref:DNA-directed DNA polymerase n=3 Tax=root TaxID=1 RepID=A0A160U4I5_9ZZZZ|nr:MULTISPECIES: DNA polymerase I [unclassified Hyphomonas]MAL43315.1 DNA polymerase I [Hyphomonas sp.]MAX82616.1 DNA polymerase I [Hyphomonas sp.]MBO6582578.1 DNA polymerase I [Hyphomonas sp.]HAO37404.1 DNA polymerase I [Hyphomonas sp.]HBJ39748.1 DNA polymerase I [Hyphomonas sp.]|tara:strand:+ start:2100 stop:4889 length:2790 start_codon:yes stop_codon:yes gene_type:complete